MANFKAGQRVVCKDNDSRNGKSIKHLLKVNDIYTIAKTDGFNVLLKEVKSHHWSGEFCGSHFRPLDETFAEGIIEKLQNEINETKLEPSELFKDMFSDIQKICEEHNKGTQ